MEGEERPAGQPGQEAGRADDVGPEREGQGEPSPSRSPGGAGEPVELSYAQYEELKTLAKERDDYLKRLQRAVADYQNLQKRIERFRESGREAAIRSLAEEILPVADSLARAREAAEQAEGAADIVAGLSLVEKEFYGGLAKFGIHPVEAVGQEFNPHYHEAVMQDGASEAPPNTVVRELKRGFVMGDAVIRPSQVIVSPSARANAEAASDEAQPPDGA